MFEEGMANLLGKGVCEIHVFDFTDFSHKVPDSIRDMVHFHAWGLKTSGEKVEERVAPRQQTQIFRTLNETIELLGHRGQIIDIFKIDCEGCEWGTFHDWVNADVDIRQILVEVHNVPPAAQDFFLSMQNAGYVTFHKEPNIEFAGGQCIEYCFLKLGKAFFLEHQS